MQVNTRLQLYMLMCANCVPVCSIYAGGWWWWCHVLHRLRFCRLERVPSISSPPLPLPFFLGAMFHHSTAVLLCPLFSDPTRIATRASCA